MRKIRLKTTLSLVFALLVAVTVFLTSILSGILINHQFETYVTASQKAQAKELADSIGSNYDATSAGFNIDYVHGMGMYALKEGYVLRLYDANDQLLWDAENHDMALCHDVMEGIQAQMEEHRPHLHGEFVTTSYELGNGTERYGTLEISYYTPYYLNENGFRFVEALNRILWVIGALAVLAAVGLGILISGRITNPIGRVIAATGRISGGDYNVRIPTDWKERETSELSDAINTMAATLQEQEYLRKQLTADIAHELRTPVTNISSYLEMMADGIMEPTSERLTNCYDEAQRLSELIADLERLQRAESTELILQTGDVDLYELSASILQGFETKAREKELDLHLEGAHVTVEADAGRMGQVIANLLSNAIKYTDQGSINVGITTDGVRVELAVEDTGIGIPQEERERIFERFYRTDRSRTRKTGGAGIGLTITKAIVQAHGGEIRCEERPGGGSRFVVILDAKGHIETV
ncbi:MAG: HAMP domain-containing histidine kinase [Lachnospiraceae bacterium]|nr:HAMP domain-containing histidine kinase [Lachnospiraceae bacterium]